MAPFGAPVRPRTLTGRLLLWHAVAVLGVLLALGVVVDRVLEHYFVEQLTDSLVSDARAVQQTLPPGDPVESGIIALGRAMGVRITVIRTDGVVLADSEHDPATMENHRTRPEVVQALAGHVGVSSRPSATIGIPFRYVALPPAGGRIVRVALPLTSVQSRLRVVRAILAAGLAFAALAGLAALTLIARGVTRPLTEMSRSVERVAAGDLEAHVPERGTTELVALARAVNEMRSEIATRIAALELERSARDAILSTLEEGVALVDGDGTVLYQNESSRRLIGALPTTGQLTPATLQQAVAEAARSGISVRREVVAAVPVPNDGRILFVTRDVTEARAVDAVRRDFVANASHELKTPVASVQALAETIATAVRDDAQAIPRFASQLEREAGRLGRVVSDLLDLTRLEGREAGDDEIRLDRLVADEVDRNRERAAEAGLRFGLSDRSSALVRGSLRDLGLLVRNLVENAIQYTRPGGTVDVSVTSGGGHAVLVVSDTGIGIPARDRTRVFERFYRVDRARSRETGGTGLGLSIVKHVAENHGGTVTVETGLGAGSTFIVRLPLLSGDRPNG